MNHGTTTGYKYGCRCLPCRSASATQRREERERRELLGPAYVPAERCRRHLRELRRRDVTVRAIAEASGLSQRAVNAIIAGKTATVRRDHNEALLAVTATAPHSSFVTKEEVQPLLDELSRAGVTNREIMAVLGYNRTDSLPWKKTRCKYITRRNFERLCFAFEHYARLGVVSIDALVEVER